MIPATLAEVAAVVGGALADASGDERVTGPATLDSRDVVAGGLFVAIAGEHVDGHDYAARAHAGGAAGVLAARATGVPTVVVDDPGAALGLLARHVRDRLPATRVLAMTGSQGKTGTKDYLAGLLEHALPGDDRVVATRGNLNNELGVPLTVLRATGATTHLVVEMGARGVGHVRLLCVIARPDVAAVLNVGSAHVGEFGSVDAIARAKGEIVEGLADDGVAVLAAEDPRVAPMASRTRARVLTFGAAGAGADVTWDDVRLDERGRPGFVLRHGDAAAEVRLALPGRHQVANATAAAALALALDDPRLDVAAVAAGLTAARPASRWRMEVVERADGLVVVNDAYNANPASVRAALDTLVDLGAAPGRRTVAVLGEMLELGDSALAEHREVGAHAAAVGVDLVVTVGPAGEAIAAGARTAGAEVVVTAGRDEASRWVRENAGPDDVVLVKASRGVALETLAQDLTDHEQTDHEQREDHA